MFSLRWKLTLGLLGLTLTFVLIYIYLAKQTFETDKISYVFETQQNQVEALAGDLQRDFEKAVFDLHTIAFLAAASGKVNSDALKVFFQSEERLAAVEARPKDGAAPQFSFEKTKDLLAKAPPYSPDWKDPKPQFNSLGNGHFSLSMAVPNEKQEWVVLKSVFRPQQLLSDPYNNEILMITEDQKMAEVLGLQNLAKDALTELIQKMGSNQATVTRSEDLRGEPYLISRSRSVQGHFSFWALTPKAEALGALRILYAKSELFLGFSVFAALFLALLLSYGLTKNINLLTAVARRVATGDFSIRPMIESRDEIGILSKTFSQMIAEIQKLLAETADKVRMENELKTARVVQESLFPVAKEAQAGNMRLAGFYTTSSECGGDWWYYFLARNEFQAIIADATGHGTPAALITAAARSIYTHIQTQKFSLSDSAGLLDRSIHDCSSGRLTMTSFMVRIDIETGVASFLNASHEDPVLLTPNEKGGYSAEFLAGNMSSTLGERKGVWVENSFVLEPGQILVIWTDGLTAMPAAANKAIGEKRLLKQFEKAAQGTKSPAEVCKNLYENLWAFGDNVPLIDDVTLIAIENTKRRA